MRLLDRSSRVPAASRSSGFAPRHADALRARSSRRPHGIVLVTGPTGSRQDHHALRRARQDQRARSARSSRSRTRSSTSSRASTRSRCSPKIGLTFASGLRHIVRQDPDVIMVGEIRDLETAEIAIQAALTGHLVFSTLHTNDAAGRHHATARHGRRALPGRLGAGAACSPSGSCAASARRAACPTRRSRPTSTRSASTRRRAASQLFRGKGCDECRGTGYRGPRRHLRAVPASPRTSRSLILRRASTREIRRHAIERGMVTLRVDGWAKALRGRHHGRGDPARHAGRRRRHARLRLPGSGPAGQTIDGVMEAPDARAVVERLQRDAYFPIKVAPQDERRRAWAWPGRRRAAAACAGRDLLAAHPAARHAVRGGPAARPRARHPRGAGARPRALRAIVTDLLHSVRGGTSLARGARQAPPAPVLAPLRQHGARGREGRRARGHAAAAGRVPRGVAGASTRRWSPR